MYFLVWGTDYMLANTGCLFNRGGHLDRFYCTFCSCAEIDHFTNGSLYGFGYRQRLDIHSILCPRFQACDKGMNHCGIWVRLRLDFKGLPPVQGKCYLFSVLLNGIECS